VHPCSGPPGEIHLGPLTVPGARNRAISGEKLPLVVVSHPLQRGVRCEPDLGEGALPMRLPPLRRGRRLGSREFVDST
jgi:hypothetical protein